MSDSMKGTNRVPDEHRSSPWPGVVPKAVLATAVGCGLAESVRAALFGPGPGFPWSVLVLCVGASACVAAVSVLWVSRPLRRLIRASLELSRHAPESSRIGDDEIPAGEIGDAMRAHNLVLDRTREVLAQLHAANVRLQEASEDLREHREKLRENYLVVEAIKDDLEAKNRELREVDRRRSEFLANVAHELRTPLHAITGFTELTLKTQKGLNPRGRGNLERVIRSGHELVRLIDDLLDLARLEAGKLAVHTEAFNLGEMIDECIGHIEPLVREKDVRLEVRLEGDFRKIRQDRAKLRQIVLNLIANAAKFTERGTIRILAETAEGESAPLESAGAVDRRCLVLHVEDTGVGIPPEHLDRIFEQFARVEDPASGQIGGTGLGLRIVKQLAQLLGGEAKVESRPGEGSRFTVCVPLPALEAPGPVHAGAR